MKRVLVVNLPHPTRVQRRWVASYQAPNFLLPPLEAMGLTAHLDAQGVRVRLVDAVAMRWSARRVADAMRSFAPELVVALAGFQTLPQDLVALGRIRDLLQGSRSVLFGHLPTEAPERLAALSQVDFVVRGEAEETVLALALGDEPSSIAGLAFAGPDGVVMTPARPRIRALDVLPAPSHDLNLTPYREPFMPRPLGVLETARGCPYPCTYCVRAYGRDVVMHSPEWIGEAARGLRARGLRHLRFLDDTFTLDRTRALGISDRLGPLGMTWTCLTRLDRLDRGLCLAMKSAGCRRLYVGVESADPEQLAQWRKGETVQDFERGAAAARSAGLELSGFFIVGGDHEHPGSARESAALAHRLGLDFVIVTRLQTWPGTALHDGATDPSAWGVADEEDPYAVERQLYRRFYLAPRQIARHARRAVRYPQDAAAGLLGLGRYVSGAMAGRDFI